MTTLLYWLFLIASMAVLVLTVIIAGWDVLTRIGRWLDKPHGRYVDPDADFYDPKEHRDCHCHKRSCDDGQKDCEL